jgi:hypothetical protein
VYLSVFTCVYGKTTLQLARVHTCVYTEMYEKAPEKRSARFSAVGMLRYSKARTFAYGVLSVHILLQSASPVLDRVQRRKTAPQNRRNLFLAAIRSSVPDGEFQIHWTRSQLALYPVPRRRGERGSVEAAGTSTVFNCLRASFFDSFWIGRKR